MLSAFNLLFTGSGESCERVQEEKVVARGDVLQYEGTVQLYFGNRTYNASKLHVESCL